MSATTNAAPAGFVLAFDLGGSRLKAGAVDRGTLTVGHLSVTTSARDADTALAALERIGLGILAARPCSAVALAVPGLVDDDGRIVALPGKLDGIVGRDLRGWLRARFDLPALVCNDAVAFGLGEANHGAGRGHERVVVMTIGTGVGVAVVQAGLPITRGALGGGLLGGQIPIDEGLRGPVDTNGKRGTIEALCAANRIVDRARAAGGTYDSVETVYDAWHAGERAARAGVDAYRRDLARALVALAHAHTPSAIVLGGGPMVAGNPVFVDLQPLVAEQLWPGYAVDLELARLGEHAALVGLADLVERTRAWEPTCAGGPRP